MMEKQYADRFAAFDENYGEVLEKLQKAAELSGRGLEDIILLAATKTVPVEVVNYAIRQGVSCIGENRVQELLEKFDSLEKERCDVQFIGRLQTNKVKYLVDKVSCIQSVDSMKLAREISKAFAAAQKHVDVLIEVNVGREGSKGGVMPEELLEFIDEARALPGLTVRGLMAIPPICGETQLLKYFSEMNQYFVDIKAKSMDNVYMDRLSMGMSSDFPLAVRCGANMVRVGTALFGKRA